MSWRSVPTTKESKKTLTHRGLAATGACKINTGACHEKTGENPPCPPTGRSSTDAEMAEWCPLTTRHLVKERSSSCRTQSNRRRLISRCQEGGWRHPKEPHRHGNAHTDMCVDDKGCSGSGAPVSSPSVEKETELRQVSESHTPYVCKTERSVRTR